MRGELIVRDGGPDQIYYNCVQCTCNPVAFEMVASKMGDQICDCLWSVAKIKIKKSIVTVKAKYSDYTEQLNN